MSTSAQLLQVFNNNFVAYYRSHAAHINIVGRNFVSDHELLKGIYEARQAEIDIIGELIRTVGEFVPDSLSMIIADSEIADVPVLGTADELLADVRGNLEMLLESYITLDMSATDEGKDEIANYAQEQILALRKDLWMLNSTLD